MESVRIILPPAWGVPDGTVMRYTTKAGIITSIEPPSGVTIDPIPQCLTGIVNMDPGRDPLWPDGTPVWSKSKSFWDMIWNEFILPVCKWVDYVTNPNNNPWFWWILVFLVIIFVVWKAGRDSD